MKRICILIIKLNLIGCLQNKLAFCLSSEKAISKAEFEQRNVIILAESGGFCESACSTVGYCNFEDYVGLADEDREDLLVSAIRDGDCWHSRTSCNEEGGKFRNKFLTLRENYIDQKKSNTYPVFNPDNCCISGYGRNFGDPSPICGVMQEGNRKLCTCRKSGHTDPDKKTSSSISQIPTTAEITAATKSYVDLVATTSTSTDNETTTFTDIALNGRTISTLDEESATMNKSKQQTTTTVQTLSYTAVEGGTYCLAAVLFVIQLILIVLIVKERNKYMEKIKRRSKKKVCNQNIE